MDTETYFNTFVTQFLGDVVNRILSLGYRHTIPGVMMTELAPSAFPPHLPRWVLGAGLLAFITG
ncbi:hypothetical protein ACNKHW_09995 [Shigella flexneri]